MKRCQLGTYLGILWICYAFESCGSSTRGRQLQVDVATTRSGAQDASHQNRVTAAAADADAERLSRKRSQRPTMHSSRRVVNNMRP